MEFRLKLVLLSSFSVAAAFTSSIAVAQTCESLAGVVLPHATITAAQSVTGGIGVQVQRPLCPFPDVPRLVANGDPANADSFKRARDLPQ